MRLPAAAERGFTLIELIITIVVTAIAFTALGIGLVAAVRDSVDPVVSMRAATLAQAYLDEIVGKQFDENGGAGGVTRCDEAGQPACSNSFGPDGGETRANYDDVDDYHGLDETPPRNVLGQIESQYDGFRVQVSVAYAGNDFSASFGTPNRSVKRVTVTVSTPVSGSFVFASYRGNF